MPEPTAAGALRRALEEALLANPDDRAAHSAYADLLSELADPADTARGEFISVQLALEDESRPADERARLEQREADLLQAHGRTWLGALAPFLLDNVGLEEWFRQSSGHDQLATFRFRRGWLDTLHLHLMTIDLGRALRHAPQLALVRELLIDASAYEGEPEPDDGSPADEPGNGLWPLSQSPHLGNVRRFQLGRDDGDDYEIYNCHLHTESVVPLVRRMPLLQELRLFVNAFDLAELLALPTLTELRLLQVYHLDGVHRLQVLADNPACRNLTHLLLHPHALTWYRNEERDEAAGYREEEGYLPLAVIRTLLRSANLPSLQHLRLRVSSMGDEGCAEVVGSGILKRLKTLDLRHGRITDPGARTLASCPDLKRLEWLDVRENSLSDEGVGLLAGLGIPGHFDLQHGPGARDDDEYLGEGEWE
jgi:uncharacterized protein (TIGR02996 family)